MSKIVWEIFLTFQIILPKILIDTQGFVTQFCEILCDQFDQQFLLMLDRNSVFFCLNQVLENRLFHSKFQNDLFKENYYKDLFIQIRRRAKYPN